MCITAAAAVCAHLRGSQMRAFKTTRLIVVTLPEWALLARESKARWTRQRKGHGAQIVAALVRLVCWLSLSHSVFKTSNSFKIQDQAAKIFTPNFGTIADNIHIDT